MIEDRTIALAGVIQACTQVQKLAREGLADEAIFTHCLKSILVLDAVNSYSVYSGKKGVEAGLQSVANGVLQTAQVQSVEITRYAMTILHLQSKLFSNPAALQRFATEVERLSAVESEDLVRACATIYQENISVISPQIIVQGEPEFLQQVRVAEKIRCMLLAALRSAVLWQQKEGSRFKLLWQRGRMRATAQALLANHD